MQFLLGTAMVLGATYLYSGPDRKRGRPPPISIVNYEKTTVDNTPKYVDEAKLNVDPMDSARGRNFGVGLGISTSRPSSPMVQHIRAPSARGKKFDD